MVDALAPRYERYPVGDGAEWMLVRGPETGARVLILGALLNEGHLLRALTIETARRLAARGFGCAVPDLPGCGESLLPLRTAGWNDWRTAAAAAAEARRAADGSPPHVVSLRGGCLMDDAADAASRWRYAPVDGSALLRPLERAHRVANRESGVVEQEHGAVPLAGYSFAPALLDGLRAAKPTAPERCRTVTPEGAGLPLWRRAEPGTDPELSERLATDIAEWISSCAS